MKQSKNLLVLFVFAFGILLSAQSERKITRNGNTQYEIGNFVEAEINYKKALEQNPALVEAQFNLGDALVKQERYEEALASFDAVSTTTEDAALKASAFHNKGNVQLKQQDLEGAIASYEEALRANPKDHQTRYNYAYAKKQLKQQQQQEQEQEQEQDQDQNEEDQEDKKDQEENKDSKDKGDQNKEDSENKDSEDSEENKEEQQDQGENKEDTSEEEQKEKGETDGHEPEEEQKEKGETDGQEAEEEQKQKEQQAETKENKLSPEEAQRLLEALNKEENKVQAKMKKHKIKGAKVKIEKDW
tara:strand:- start:497 stop:1402 length:906 start_codon:yes stop_codon:yes gene_type:complete